MYYKLLIKLNNNIPQFAKKYYNKIAEDTQSDLSNNIAYLDLICPDNVVIDYGDTAEIDLKIECKLTNFKGEEVPIKIHSNIGIQHPIQMIDNVKIFFTSHIGNVCINVRYSFLNNQEIIKHILSGELNEFEKLKYNIKKNNTIFRLVTTNYTPMKVFIVNNF
jgi:hypothetical protein